MRPPVVFALAISLLGCAHTRHDDTPRATLGYTDRKLFAITHYDAGPTGGNTYAGRLAGRACGVDITYNAQYYRSRLRLNGFVKSLDRVAAGFQADKPAFLEVRDRNTPAGILRTIEGSVGNDLPEYAAGVSGAKAMLAAQILAMPRHNEVELKLTHERISGVAGMRRFDLHAEGDRYEGRMIIANHVLPFRLKGRGALWSMPAADQAAILPFVITCIVDDRALVQDVDMGYYQ
jgi:hypothetical protein